jgi:hypothetical protein
MQHDPSVRQRVGSLPQAGDQPSTGTSLEAREVPLRSYREVYEEWRSLRDQRIHPYFKKLTREVCLLPPMVLPHREENAALEHHYPTTLQVQPPDDIGEVALFADVVAWLAER